MLAACEGIRRAHRRPVMPQVCGLRKSLRRRTSPAHAKAPRRPCSAGNGVAGTRSSALLGYL